MPCLCCRQINLKIISVPNSFRSVILPAMLMSSCLMNLTASMNSVSLEPRSLSIASFVAPLTSNGPGVKSFLSAESRDNFL